MHLITNQSIEMKSLRRKKKKQRDETNKKFRIVKIILKGKNITKSINNLYKVKLQLSSSHVIATFTQPKL
jgi:hypothetical protein